MIPANDDRLVFLVMPEFDLAVRVFLDEPEDFVGVVAFLPSEAPNFITGQTIYLDGGRTIL